MTKKRTIILASITLIALMIVFVSQSQSSKASRLKGTFVSAENTFNTIVFDYDDDETFYFYNQDDA